MSLVMPSPRIERYGLLWSAAKDPLSIEIDMIKKRGKVERKDRGDFAGNGVLFHWQAAKRLIWPEFEITRWDELRTQCFLEYTYIGEMGCAAGGKSQSACCNFLLDWYLQPWCTTTLVTSTDIPSLELRVWGMMKGYHRRAKERFPWLPGYLIEGKRMITLDPRANCEEGRDFRNGIIAVPLRKGSAFVGLQSLVGIHNKRVRLLGDELNLCPKAFLDSTSNLSKAERFKLCGLGNPNETTNAHGALCEPAPEIGGWEGGIDQAPGTKTWKTRWPGGICIQTPGSDSPNLDDPPGAPPRYPFLITREQIEHDAQIWGKDDWHFTMMVDGKMPRGQGSRRVITRQMCLKGRALEEPLWRDSRRTRIGFLDAAYGGVGGDRCVFGELQFGYEAEPLPVPGEPVVPLANATPFTVRQRQLIALIDLLIVPIDGAQGCDEPQDQIVRFVRRECENRGIPPDNFFYDAAMRTVLVTAFARLWSAQVNSIDSMGKPSERMVSEQIQVKCCDYYSKAVTQFWYDMRHCIEAQQFRGLTQDAMNEGCIREFKQVSGNRIEVESKEDMKEKSGRSPDLFDAICYGLHGACQRGFIISKIGMLRELRDPSADRWRRDARERAEKQWRAHDLDYRV